jgi:pyridoxamine 5'-phosphate oxidase
MSRPIKSLSLARLRKEYRSALLERNALPNSPFTQFDLWLSEAIEAEILEPNAMTLATASADGAPSSRTVLLKKADQQGLVFFTNYESRKAQQLSANPRASLTFLWKELERQVTVEGRVEKTSREEAADYFSQRPRASQLGAWASNQSHPIESRAPLEESYAKFTLLYQEKEVPCPPFWGGYRVIPHRFEFWQGRVNRLHDRFQYSLGTDGLWNIDRLAP